MDISAPFAMILMACSPDASHCREMQSVDSYVTRQACQNALPEMIEQHGASIGRCQRLAVDTELTTSSIVPDPADSSELVEISVTRVYDGVTVTDTYLVPSH